MALTIWKYTLEPEIEIEMPANSKILSVQEQHGKAQMWVLVNPEYHNVKRKFKSYGTGHKIDKPLGIFRGTFQLKNFGLVFHVFEETEGLCGEPR